MSRVKAVIMAGGEGTRLRPLTRSTPKPLVPVVRRRCIDYSLQSLARAGVTEVIITTSYKADMIVDALEATDVAGLSMLFSFERTAMGTAGGVAKVVPFLDDTFIVMSADVLADVDLGAMVEFHRTKGAHATMALTTVERVSEYGVVGLDDDGRIQRFQEKPAPEEAFSNLINAGIYVLEPSVMDHVPADTKFDFSRNLFPILLEEGQPMYGHTLDGLWMDIGRPIDLIAANQRVLTEVPIPMTMHAVPDGVGPGVWTDASVQYGAGMTVEGPSMLESRVVIGEGAKVRGSFLHRGVQVGAGATIVDSLVLADCQIMPHSHVEGCIIDTGSTVGEGARMVRTNVGRAYTVGPNSVHEDDVLGDTA
ncbi:MAG: NDP-sugar synthase [Thermoplasmata archaeon]|nr:MAG: NDP-sugar synthase [Thermoplasmata archaeon]